MHYKNINDWLGDQDKDLAESEHSIAELLADASLTSARRALLKELQESFAERRRGLERTRAARLARYGGQQPAPDHGHFPSRNDGRQPSRGGAGPAALWTHNQKSE